MKRSLSALVVAVLPLFAHATEQTQCSAAKGSFLTGTVTSAPKFAAASQTIQGVQLSHTLLNMRADQDGKTYQVAMDNVYAVDYVKNAQTMPASLAAITVNSRIEVCGEKYTSGTGIHWVHSNCGATPSTTAPNGWVKRISSSGSIGSNLERSQTYCYLWN